MGTLPPACTASVWTVTPRRRHISAISLIGKSTPGSLFAHITDTMAVSSLRLASSRSRSSIPAPSTGSSVTR